MNKVKRFVLSGQTSSGKNFIGARAVSGLPFEIISLDSMKVFKYMDIGTAKPTPEEQKLVKHWMIDVCEPADYFDANMYYERSEEIAQNIEKSGKHVLYVGGTPMYLRIIQNKLFEGPAANDEIRNILRKEASELGLSKLHERLAKVDENSALRIHENDEMRIIRALEIYALTGKPISELQTQQEKREDVDFINFGIYWDRPTLYERVNSRNEDMFANGWVDETKEINEKHGFGFQSSKALGYKEILTLYFSGEKTYDELKEITAMNIRRFAKRQMTWFRKFDMHWLQMNAKKSFETVIDELRNLLKKEIE